MAMLVAAPSARAQTPRELEAEHLDTFDQHVSDAIDDANDRAPSPRGAGSQRAEVWEGNAAIAEVFQRFFSGVTPNSTGVERPSADEHPIDEFPVDLGNRFSYVLLGAANNHMLTNMHFYQQFDGIHAIRYDLIRPEGTPYGFRVALAASPLYGSLTMITRHNGVASDESLPTSLIVGGAVGLDVWYTLRLVVFRARAWAMPGVEVLGGEAAGVAMSQSIQMKWRLTEVFGWDPTHPIDFGLIFLHVDRGTGRQAIYDWQGEMRSPAELREVWQVTALVELRVD